MKKRHIAVFTPLVGGHIYPALGLSSELVSRGHCVTYPIDETFAGRVRDAGVIALEFKAPEVKNVEMLFQDTSDDSRFWRAFTSVIGPWTMAAAAAAVEELQGYYAENPPDVILYDWFAFGGRILARKLGCPAIQMHSHFAHPRDSLMRVNGICTTPEPMRGFAKLLDSFMTTYGFENRDHMWYYEELNLFLIPRAFQYSSETFDEKFQFFGATHNRKPRVGMWKKRTEQGKPLVLISESTSSTDGELLRLGIEAFADSDYHVVVSKALNTPEVPLGSLPLNFEINRTAFNCEILPFANAMVCEGGMGTTLESLYHGVPVVALPTNPFNAEVAYRMAELGLGVDLRQRGISAHTIREAVDIACSDEGLLGRVKQMKSNLACTPGAEAAANSIEEYLAGP